MIIEKTDRVSSLGEPIQDLMLIDSDDVVLGITVLARECAPSCEMVNGVHVSLAIGNPTTDTVSDVWAPQTLEELDCLIDVFRRVRDGVFP